MFGTFNPKVPATKSADGSLRWNSKGLSLNLANANTWTAIQSFNNLTYFNSTTYSNSAFVNYGDFYNYANFYDYGTMNVTNITASGQISALGGLNTQYTSGGSYYEYPYASSFNLSYTPINPYSISGNSSDGGSLSDDGYGTILSNYSGAISTVDYSTGVVTDLTSGMIAINYISYSTSGVSSYCFLYPSGQAHFSDGSTTLSICSGGVPLTVNGITAYTGELRDSTSTLIADVVGGLITAVYF